MTLRPGDVLEIAIWLDGTETPALRARFDKDLCTNLAEMAGIEGMIIGPLIMAEKRPGEDRVPKVPDHIQGPDVRLLVGEARVICRQPFFALPGSFVGDLDRKDLARLREITRRAAPEQLSDMECERIIEEIGPAAAIEALRKMVDENEH